VALRTAIEARPGATLPAFAVDRLLEPVLPEGLAAVATRGEVEAFLFPEERQALCRAVAQRRREFTTGRACAREALARLGLPRQAIPAVAGAPRWPEGVVGSITHCPGYRAAAVARAEDFAAVGIDAEPNRWLPDGVLRAIALPVERERVRRLRRELPGVCWDRLLFSAKEAVYKTWQPLTGTELGFEEAEIALDPEAGSFSAQLRVPCPARGRERPSLRGRWGVGGGILATAIALPAFQG
jgi:4'-phosphopantetheinyl transferase EntD